MRKPLARGRSPSRYFVDRSPARCLPVLAQAMYSAAAPHLGIASVDEGRFENGSWVAGRRLNGDENDQGNVWRFDTFEDHIERAALYRYR